MRTQSATVTALPPDSSSHFYYKCTLLIMHVMLQAYHEILGSCSVDTVTAPSAPLSFLMGLRSFSSKSSGGPGIICLLVSMVPCLVRKSHNVWRLLFQLVCQSCMKDTLGGSCKLIINFIILCTVPNNIPLEATSCLLLQDAELCSVGGFHDNSSVFIVL